jgi:hypothetical protein
VCYLSSLVMTSMPGVVGSGTKIANKILSRTDPASKVAFKPASTLSSGSFAAKKFKREKVRRVRGYHHWYRLRYRYNWSIPMPIPNTDSITNGIDTSGMGNSPAPALVLFLRISYRGFSWDLHNAIQSEWLRDISMVGWEGPSPAHLRRSCSFKTCLEFVSVHPST